MVIGNMPDGWTTATLAEASEVILGQSPSSDTYNTDKIGLPFYQGKSEFGDLYPTPVKWCSVPGKIAKEGDILISVRAPVGPTNLCQEKSCIGRGLAALRAKDGISNKYLLYYLRLIENEWDSKATGTTFKAITGDVLRNQEVPLAPLPEQERIVAKIEELFTQLEAGTAALERVQAGLKRYRASVLKAAVEGKLGIQNDEGRMQDDGQLPAGWKWVTLPEIGKLGRGKSKHRPRNADFLYGGEYPFIQTGDIRHANGIITTYNQTYSEAGLAQSKLWSKGTLCITIAANIAETAILGFDACFPDSVVGFVPNEDVEVKFVEFYIRTIKDRLERYAPATAQKNLNLDVLQKVEIPLPPLEEQRQIVAEVERRLSLAAGVESTLAASLSRAGRLRQAILKSAFEGRLV